jgi:hypothetical protein
MTNQFEMSELDRELGQVVRDLDQSRNAFLQAANLYDEFGLDLQSRVASAIEPFGDPEHDQAEEIRELATELVSEIKRFGSVRANLTMTLATLHLASESETLSLQLEVLKSAIEAFAVPNSGDDPREALDSYMSQINEAQQRNVYLAARAVLFGTETVWAWRASASVVATRQAMLQKYLGEIPNDKLAALIGAGLDGGATEAKLLALEHVMTAAALALGIAVPFVGVAVAVFNVASDVRKKQKELNKRYERNEISTMFDFRRDLRTESESTDAIVKFADKLIVSGAETAIP